ncbi:3001_t:CDS:2 [Cetraspora pellucida]|uniref:3001_t:CDS:1 n=1 Tax=Cetraspora pellucida TaxID=1433469 RepID=A0A9N8ZKV8_9GLOM|nr:3001_t:CDS:2 [Cetraspora pellucida]
MLSFFIIGVITRIITEVEIIIEVRYVAVLIAEVSTGIVARVE